MQSRRESTPLLNVSLVSILFELFDPFPDMWQRILPHSITPNVSATLIDDVDTPLPEEEVDESDNVDDEAPLEVSAHHHVPHLRQIRS